LKYLLAILCLFSIPLAYAAPGDLCFEDVDDMCGLTSGNPATVFAGLLEPLESQVPGFAMVIFWGGIMAIVWFKTENIMLLGLIGVFVNATIVGISGTSQGIGLLLLGIANGILLFQLVRQRVSIFS
jgi:hypothetical protein